ncbi:hypothetical protein PFISCL1PPCAC_7614, partial [Pristionchus fissidentatus]
VLLLCTLASTAFGVADLGMPGWSCAPDLMKRSKTVPASVHSLRPADIDVVGALGDSLTAANGAGAEHGDLLGVAIQYRGLTFSVGGDKTLDEHISMANVLKKFNPNLAGYSIRTGSANVWETAHLNAGIPGAHSQGIIEQANDLVRRIKDHPEIDYINQWKLIHIFIGPNDMCAWCVHQDTESAENYRDNIRKAVQILKDELPRTIVSLTGMIDIRLLRNVDADNKLCKETHLIECMCEQFPEVTDEMLTNEAKAYMQREQELQDSGEFDTDDDFTLIIQPFFEGVTDVSRNPDGTPNMDFFAPDCFHFSAYGHALTGKYLWNNMMQPVGSKTYGNFTDDGTPLLCPEATCPFIRTTKNSADCTKFITN